MLGLALDIWRPIYEASAPATGVITANRQVWLRKGTASGATWPDASGNARNMTLVGSPTIGATSVTFNGTTQYGTIAASGLAVTCSIYLRFKQVAWAASARVVSSSLPRLIQSASSPNIALFDSDATPYATNGNAAVGAFASLGFVQGGGVSTININGTETTDAAVGDSWGAFALAATSAGASPSNIEVVELILYDAAHDVAQRAQMITYLGTL
jgi:hypothetical protein